MRNFLDKVRYVLFGPTAAELATMRQHSIDRYFPGLKL